MSKVKTKYICSECGYESLKWMGRCPNCESWNSFVEEIYEERKGAKAKTKSTNSPAKLSSDIPEDEERLKTGIQEFDRVLGNGIMPGSVTLIGGDPGVGKSTLVMQAAGKIKEKVLYVTGEESFRQINLRAKRLKVTGDNVLVYPETNLQYIVDHIKKENPSLVIIDSIQTMYDPDFDNAPGTVTQIRESTSSLMQLAKSQNCAVIVVGHVTKEGYIAGPKILEHIVDTVLQFEGERNHTFRILRAQKNRFGSTNEIGIFEMHTDGLIEVSNPSEIFLSEREKIVTGSIVTASIEGTRPVLLEVQALVTPSNYGNPQRVATGFDYRRLSILLAVLEKRAGLRLSSSNVFLNIAGGLKVDEPAIDLAVCSAIASSFKEEPGKENVVVIGEVGLGGEVRGIGNIEKRIQEAEKLGFEEIYIPKINNKSIKKKNSTIKINPIDNIESAIKFILT